MPLCVAIMIGQCGVGIVLSGASTVKTPGRAVDPLSRQEKAGDEKDQDHLAHPAERGKMRVVHRDTGLVPVITSPLYPWVIHSEPEYLVVEFLSAAWSNKGYVAREGSV
jgi:hypothetical protein